ncbi:MAG: VanZ family protein [bacterium]
MKIKLKKLIYWIPTAVWLIFMFIASSFTVDETSGRNIFGIIGSFIRRNLYRFDNEFLHLIAGNTDKVYHSAEYLVFSILLYRSLSGSFDYPVSKNITIAASSVITIAAIDEMHQIFIKSRSCTLGDFFADLIGMMIVYIIIGLINIKRRNNELQAH